MPDRIVEYATVLGAESATKVLSFIAFSERKEGEKTNYIELSSSTIKRAVAPVWEARGGQTTSIEGQDDA